MSCISLLLVSYSSVAIEPMADVLSISHTSWSRSCVGQAFMQYQSAEGFQLQLHVLSLSEFCEMSRCNASHKTVQQAQCTGATS